MPNQIGSIEAALRSGSRSKNFSTKITDICKLIPENLAEITQEVRLDILRLASLCRSTRNVAAVITKDDVPAIDELPDFMDLFCTVYYPVMEDGKRTVGFWSVKDAATLSPPDVHEWVRNSQTNKKTGEREIVPTPFGTWWATHRPDYELYGVATDRALWQSKVIDVQGRKSVNTAYGRPPVMAEAPVRFNGDDADLILTELLNRTITDPDPVNAIRKRCDFVLDAGAHLLALRDFSNFRCLKIFCFTSTNGGQGTGKSLLHESIASLVPRDAMVCVPTTALATGNLLPLYESSVCILTEAPSTASDRYTAEDVKAFADAGWKTAEEKYVAKRSVKDNSLKLLSSNHLAPLPIDSARSRRVEFFVAAEVDDGGTSLHTMLDTIQARRGWTAAELRACIGWALLLRASNYLEEGAVPVDVARRSISAAHLLSPVDYDFFVLNGGNEDGDYTKYKDFRTDKGLTWSPDMYRHATILEMSKSKEIWIERAERLPEPPPEPKPEPPVCDPTEETEDTDDTVPVEETVAPLALQFKPRMTTAYLDKNTIGMTELWLYITGDTGLKTATEEVRAGKLDKRECLRQIFPGAHFNRFSRADNITGYTGLVHVDFDYVAENGNGLKPEQIRDTLATMPGFVIGALSSRANGAWAIFNAGDGITNYDTFRAAQRSIFALTEERMSMESDHELGRPTTGRTLAYDPDCRIADTVLGGVLPEPFEWKAPTFAVCRNPKSMMRPRMEEPTADERIRNEKFMEAVVTKSCEKIQSAVSGERHGTAVKAVANVVINCQERAVQPLSSWGRRLRDACLSCGLDIGETNGIMSYWKQKTGIAG